MPKQLSGRCQSTPKVGSLCRAISLSQPFTSPKGRQPLSPSSQEVTGRCSTKSIETVRARRSQPPQPHLACAKSTSRLSSSATQSHHSGGRLRLAFGYSFQGCCRRPSTSRPPRSGICRRPFDRPCLVRRVRARQDKYRRDVRGLRPDTGTRQRAIGTTTNASARRSLGVLDFLKGLGPHHSPQTTVLSSAGV